MAPEFIHYGCSNFSENYGFQKEEMMKGDVSQRFLSASPYMSEGSFSWEDSFMEKLMEEAENEAYCMSENKGDENELNRNTLKRFRNKLCNNPYFKFNLSDDSKILTIRGIDGIDSLPFNEKGEVDIQELVEQRYDGVSFERDDDELFIDDFTPNNLFDEYADTIVIFNPDIVVETEVGPKFVDRPEPVTEILYGKDENTGQLLNSSVAQDGECMKFTLDQSAKTYHVYSIRDLQSILKDIDGDVEPQNIKLEELKENHFDAIEFHMEELSYNSTGEEGQNIEGFIDYSNGNKVLIINDEIIKDMEKEFHMGHESLDSLINRYDNENEHIYINEPAITVNER